MVNRGTISEDARWKGGLAYRITGDITVQGTDAADSVSTLTLEHGAVVQFDGSTLNIGGGADLFNFVSQMGRTDCATAGPCSADLDLDDDVDEIDLQSTAEDLGRTTP